MRLKVDCEAIVGRGPEGRDYCLRLVGWESWRFVDEVYLYYSERLMLPKMTTAEDRRSKSTRDREESMWVSMATKGRLHMAPMVEQRV